MAHSDTYGSYTDIQSKTMAAGANLGTVTAVYQSRRSTFPKLTQTFASSAHIVNEDEDQKATLPTGARYHFALRHNRGSESSRALQ